MRSTFDDARTLADWTLPEEKDVIEVRRATCARSGTPALAEMSPWGQGAIATQEIARGWKDDLLRLGGVALLTHALGACAPGPGALLEELGRDREARQLRDRAGRRRAKGRA